jgi:hypothetical protein
MPLSEEKLPAMTLPELAQAMWEKEGTLDYQMANAEILRRQTQAQLDACAAQERSSRHMLWCAIAATVSALAVVLAAGIAVYFLSILTVVE